MNATLSRRLFLCVMACWALTTWLPSPAAAQEGGSLDDLFSDEILDVKASEATGLPAAAPWATFLKSEAVRIGGSISSSISATATWNNPWNGTASLWSPDSSNLKPSLSGLLYFDARPDDSFRVYGSFKTRWPFRSTVAGLAEPTVPVSVPTIQIFELFSDFQQGDRLSFRFGKATVKWGVGYFFSPADIINLEPINLFDPEAQREGPVQFRLTMPFGPSMSMLSAYALFDEHNPDWATTAFAAKIELVAGKYEIGLSGYYRQDTAERAALTLAGPLGDFDVFAEAVISRGSPKNFYSFSAVPPYVQDSKPADHRTTVYPSATIGLLYNNQSSRFTTMVQYFFNGEGYSNAERDAAFAILQPMLANPSTPEQVRAALQVAAKGFALGSGRHYGALSMTRSGIFDTERDVDLSILGLWNLSDSSGLVRPSITWKLADRISLGAALLFVFGEEKSEYAVLSGGNPASLTLTLSAGSGRF